MQNILNISLVITAAVLIVLVLLQGGSSRGVNALTSGRNSELSLFTNKKTFGFERGLKITTLVFGFLLIILSMVSRMM